jgi:hypothetical protein
MKPPSLVLVDTFMTLLQSVGARAQHLLHEVIHQNMMPPSAGSIIFLASLAIGDQVHIKSSCSKLYAENSRYDSMMKDPAAFPVPFTPQKRGFRDNFIDALKRRPAHAPVSGRLGNQLPFRDHAGAFKNVFHRQRHRPPVMFRHFDRFAGRFHRPCLLIH